MPWITDLKEGREAEHLLYERLKGEKRLAPDRYFPGWDIWVEGMTIEVKADRMAHKTNNLYIELKALQKSKAHVWAIGYGQPIQAFYLVTRKDLLNFVSWWPYSKFGGDFKDEGKLINRQLFIQLLNPRIITIDAKGSLPA